MTEQVFTNLTNCGPVSVYVNDGVVTRILPLVADEADYRPWVIEADGKKYSPPKKFNLAPMVHAERRRLYSDERIKYPMKRVDFDPNGERNPQNRGKSAYERISWDEALDLVSGEITRVQEKYGKSAISGMTSSHHNWGIVGYKMGPFMRFMNCLEATPVFDNPDSWEGWHWGATHAYGFYWRLGMPEPFDNLEDVLQNSELMVFWSNDPDTTRGTYSGQESAIWRTWLREKGVQTVFIDPFHNYTNALFDEGKWIAPRMGTDAALAMAIAYVWITEGSYDKQYIADRTIGFDEFKPYVLGETDGVPKTPEWAAEESGVEARVIRTLAREWASKRTALAAGARGGEGSACRTAYGTEWARMMVLLQAMQGLGKPGITIGGISMGAPADFETWFPGYAEPQGRMSHSTKAADYIPQNSTKQRLYRLTVPDAILDPPVEWDGAGFCGQSLEQQFEHFVYPADGCSEIKLWYRYGGSFMGTMSDTTKWVRMYQSPKLEFVVNQDVWYNSETRMADVILPACTNFEREDIGEFAACNGYTTNSHTGNNYRVIVREQKCIEPLGESRSDYQILADLSERLGIHAEFTDGGKTEIDWVKAFFDCSDLAKLVDWETFDKKGYYIINAPQPYEPKPCLRWFAEGRPCDTPDTGNPKRGTDKAHELGTYSGKIEFASESLRAHFPDDQERPVSPRYIESWEGHHTTELFEKYPLQLMSPHPRFSFHCHYDKHTDWLDDIPVHRMKKDGYAWWPVRLSPADAAARGIRHGDIVRMHNDRGSVLGCAVVTERIRPGIVHSYASSAKYDPLEPGKADSVDKGGCVNMLTSSRMLSSHAPGMTPNGMLIDVTRCNGCHNCFLACRDEHYGNEYPGYSAAQPLNGQFWMQVKEVEGGRYPRPRLNYIAIPCQNCQNAPCIDAGKDGAVYRREDGIVMIDPEKAKGQDQIVASCPYRVVYWNAELQLPQKCGFCAHRLDAGDRQPRCAQSCPTGAVTFGDLDDPESALAKRMGELATEVFHPEYETGPLVVYAGLPGRMVAGEVVLDGSDACAAGVKVTLEGDGVSLETASSAFGEFAFERLPAGKAFKVTVAAEGFPPRAFDVKTHTDVDLGEVVLTRT